MVNGLDFIDRQSLVCSRDVGLCQVLAQDGGFLYTDTNHWSYEGRDVFGKLIVQRFGHLFASTRAAKPLERANGRSSQAAAYRR